MFYLWLIPNTHYFSDVECLPLSFFLKKKLRLQHDNQTDFHDLPPGGLSQAGISTGSKAAISKPPLGVQERIRTEELIVVFPYLHLPC